MTRIIGLWFFGIMYGTMCISFGLMQVMAFIQVYGWWTFSWMAAATILSMGMFYFCLFEVRKDRSCSLGD